jgi:hypothetical protein
MRPISREEHEEEDREESIRDIADEMCETCSHAVAKYLMVYRKKDGWVLMCKRCKDDVVETIKLSGLPKPKIVKFEGWP